MLANSIPFENNMMKDLLTALFPISCFLPGAQAALKDIDTTLDHHPDL